MCGFILAPDYFRSKVTEALDHMAYRGADGFRGVVEKGGWVLGHVRLAIQTDASFGQQPFVDDGGRRAFAFVGEVFGRNLQPLLVSEEEVLRSALHSLALREFMDLDGFWSVAEVQANGAARVLTDHLGIKPVYFWAQHGIFCSEIEPMFELAHPPELDEVYLANCIKFGYDYSGRTPWKGITQVAPGTVMTFNRNTLLNFEAETYWDWGRVPIHPMGGSRADGLHYTLTQATLSRASAVRHRAVGLLLSGGLDSTIIYSILRNHGLLDDVLLYSIENGESEFLPSGVTILPARGLTCSFSKAARIMQAPLDLGSLSPQIELAEALAGQNCRVCLTGDGADELFGGYRRSLEYDSQASDVFCELPYYHLPRLDRVHMRSTTEIRSPFLAPSVVALALRLPRAERTGKQILKNAFARQIPKAVLERPKQPLRDTGYSENPLLHRAQLVEAFRNEYQR